MTSPTSNWTRSFSRKLGLLAATLVVGFAAQSAYAGYEWVDTDNGIVCGQMNGDGDYTPVDDAPCMKAQPPKVEWQNSNGHIKCAEETPQGGLLQFIDISYCVKRLTTKIQWTLSGGKQVCSRVTSSGAVIGNLDPSQCSGQPAPTPAPVNPPTTQPTPTTANPSQPSQPTTGPGIPGFHWSDTNHTSCILYGNDGFVKHLAPPASCASAQ